MYAQGYCYERIIRALIKKLHMGIVGENIESLNEKLLGTNLNLDKPELEVLWHSWGRNNNSFIG